MVAEEGVHFKATVPAIPSSNDYDADPKVSAVITPHWTVLRCTSQAVLMSNHLCLRSGTL